MNLAQEPPFRLGVLAVSPSTCRVSWAGSSQVLQPRVMKVLVTLANANAAVVSRETLISECWDGRIVGDDAVIRIMVMLRRLSSNLQGQGFELENIPRVGYRLIPAAGGDPVALVIPHPRRRQVLALSGIGVVAAAGAGGWLWWGRRPGSAAKAEPLTIAVLPFDDLSPGASAGYLSRGLAREVRDTLSRVAGLRVIADTSSFPVHAQTRDPRELGRRLGAQLLLGGAVTQSGSGLRINLELTDPNTGQDVWTHIQSGRADDLFSVLDGASESVIQALVGRIGPDRIHIASVPRPRDPMVFRRVLVATELLDQSRALRMVGQESAGEDAAESARALLDEALKIDPGDTGALVALANITRNGWTRVLGALPLSQVERANEAAQIIRQALISDPNDPGALTALGDYYRRFEWRWKEAENLFRRAIATDPSLVEARWSYAYELGELGRAKEGLVQAQELFRLDPENLWRRVALARLLYLAGERDAALKRYDIELAADPRNAFLVREVYLMFLSEGNAGALKRLNQTLRTVLWRDKRMTPAIFALSTRIDAALAALSGTPQALLGLVDADVAALDGPAGRAATQQGRASVDLPYIYALEYAWSGQADLALRMLKRALAAGSLYWPATLPYGPAEFPPPVRNDPRFAALWSSDPRLVELMRSRKAAVVAGQMAKPWRHGPDWRA